MANMTLSSSLTLDSSQFDSALKSALKSIADLKSGLKELGSNSQTFKSVGDSAKQSESGFKELKTAVSKLGTALSSASKKATQFKTAIDGIGNAARGIGNDFSGINQLAQVAVDSSNSFKELKLSIAAFTRAVTSSDKKVTKYLETMRILHERTAGLARSFNQLGSAVTPVSDALRSAGSRASVAANRTRLLGVEAHNAWASTRGFRQAWYDLGISLRSGIDLIKNSITVFAAFDDSIRAAAAVTGEEFTGAFDQFKSAAKEAGETTRYTAAQAGQALQFLAMAGLSVQQSIAALPSTLRIAQAGNLSLARSADIVTNVMSQYAIQTSDLGRAVDVLTKTFTSSNTSLSLLATSFIYTGSIAKASNQTFEQTNALLGVLANNGYQGGKAGRTLANAFSRLQRQIPLVADSLEKYNVKTHELDPATGQATQTMRPLVEILEELREKGVTVADAMTIFGQIAGPGIVALLAPATNGIASMTDQIKIMELQLYGLSKTNAAEFLKNITNESSGVVESLSSAGISATKFNGDLKTLPEILSEIKASGSDIDLNTIFAPEDAEKFTTVLDSGVTTVDEFASALAQINNTAQTVADQMESGLGGSIRRLSSAWESVKIAAIDAIGDQTQTQFDGFTQTLRENREAISGLIANLTSFGVGMAECVESRIAFAANNQSALVGLGWRVASIVILKYQILELS